MTEPVTKEKLPPDRSRAADNAFYHHCEFYAGMGGRANYGVCLFKILAVEEDRLRETDVCHGPITHGRCPALVMRSEEECAGRALYFIDREKQRAEFEAKMDEKMRELRNRPGWKEGRPQVPEKSRPGLQLKTTKPDPSKSTSSKPEKPRLEVKNTDSLMQKALNRRIKKEMNNDG